METALWDSGGTQCSLDTVSDLVLVLEEQKEKEPTEPNVSGRDGGGALALHGGKERLSLKVGHGTRTFMFEEG